MTTIDWKAYFDVQANGCTRDGSPLYGELVARLSEDHAAGGIVAELLEGWQGNPAADGLAMRILGAVHHLVLSGDAPKLARHYPSMGGSPVYPEVGALFIAALREHRDFVAKRLGEQVQTNEVRRSAALLPGFLSVAASTGLPLRLFEIGASAGLNQLWDQYRYALGESLWGDPAGEPLLATEWRGNPPAIGAEVRVASRAACDLYPVDLRDPDSRRRLDAFIWPDQPERRERFNRAADAVVRQGVAIDRSTALEWLESRLAEPADGSARVLFHSVMWLYIDPDERRAIESLMARLGEAASDAAPLAWLRMEGRSFDHCELRLALWPTGEDRLVGTCGFHGQWVDWIG